MQGKERGKLSDLYMVIVPYYLQDILSIYVH